MSVKKAKVIVTIFLLVCAAVQSADAESAGLWAHQGNRLYGRGEYNQAIEKYDQALIEQPTALEPKFNKANSYYRLDDLDKAIQLYKEVAADSKDMALVTKSKYNLGNSWFQQGCKQRDSNLQKALEDLKTSIAHWRTVLDIEAENEKAAKNIEVARLMIKDIIDQLNKQQQDPNQPQQQQQDPNQPQQQQRQDPNQPPQQQQQQNQQQDPNQPQDPNQQQQQEQENQKETAAADATAEQILDKEQREKKQRQMLQRGRYQKVEKDW